jgi:plasmid stabilization system protein ParE
MKTYNVKINAAANADLMSLALFLRKVMSIEGAWKYHQIMLNEVHSLSILADLYPPSHYADIRRYHPHARRMVSHNKRWVYIFHIEDDTVMVDRILPSKLITK